MIPNITGAETISHNTKTIVRKPETVLDMIGMLSLSVLIISRLK
jgi:hypothetical protein